LWDLNFQAQDFLRESAKTVMHDDKGISAHQHVSWVVLYGTPRVIGFYFFLFGIYLRDFAVHSDGVSSADVGHCILLLFWIVSGMYLLLLLLFCLFCDYCDYCALFIKSFYARLVVRIWRD
jgi:hypothetical protein